MVIFIQLLEGRWKGGLASENQQPRRALLARRFLRNQQPRRGDVELANWSFVASENQQPRRALLARRFLRNQQPKRGDVELANWSFLASEIDM